MSSSRRDGRSLAAARWALANVTTLSAASRKFGVQIGTVGDTWRRLFPDVPALVSRRSGSRLHAWPEDECSW